jgi:hypothetical protein
LGRSRPGKQPFRPEIFDPSQKRLTRKRLFSWVGSGKNPSHRPERNLHSNPLEKKRSRAAALVAERNLHSIPNVSVNDGGGRRRELVVQRHGVARLGLTEMARLNGNARQGNNNGDSSISHVLLCGTVLSSFPLLSVVSTMVASFLGMDLDYGLVHQLKCQHILVLRLAQPN